MDRTGSVEDLRGIAALITLMVYEYAATCIIGRHDNALNSADPGVG